MTPTPPANSHCDDMAFTFNRLVAELLQKEFPNLSADFIAAHREDLMNMLAANNKAAAAGTPLGTAPGTALQVVAPDPTPRITESQKHLLGLLDANREDILANNIAGMLLMTQHTDGRMNVLYSKPCNIFSWLGLLHSVIGRME